MADLDRRRFLQFSASAAGLAVLPASIQKALAIPANHKTGTIMDVEHVVILMQENRSFDHYFGCMPGVRGYGDRFTIPLPEGRNVWEQRFLVKPDVELNLPGPAQNPKPRAEPTEDRIVMPYYLDASKGNAQRVTGTPHSWDNAQAAWDQGRMHEWPSYKRTWSMGYYQQPELEFQYALANAFTLCDAYHCSFHGSTNPNRLFLFTGTNDPSGAGGGPAINNQYASLGPSTEGYTWKTYAERLEEAGVSWKVYQNHPLNFSDNSLEGFVNFRLANEAAGNGPSGAPWLPYLDAQNANNPLYKGCANTMPDLGMLQTFKLDVLARKLPQVSYIIAPDRYSEHPDPSSPILGAWYVQEALEALTAVPEVWSKTILIVNFDENDGFFDHLPPPCAPSRLADGSTAGKTTLADTSAEYHNGEVFNGGVYGPGPRVPLYAVSPWSRGGWVCSETYDHTSVLRFLEQRFGVAEPNISPWRRSVCGDLTACFDFATPNAGVPMLPFGSLVTSELINESQASKDQVPLPSTGEQELPVQVRGTRLSRALPYELHATATVSGNRVRVAFANSGAAGAVFHVYDRLHLDRAPRRYGVEAGKALDDAWDTSADGGQYDLWLLSHNGWHRHFTGGPRSASAEVQVCYDAANGDVILKNHGGVALNVTDAAYSLGGPWNIPARGEKSFDLSGTQGWYDFEITLEHDSSGWSRRCAGRVETGRPGFSDPAMGKRR